MVEGAKSFNQPLDHTPTVDTRIDEERFHASNRQECPDEPTTFDNSDAFIMPLALLLEGIDVRLPDDVCREIGQMLSRPLTDNTIREAARSWCHEDLRCNASKHFGLIERWDVGQVTNMDQLFATQPLFNDDLSRWNVSGVRSMREMFDGCRAFNQPLHQWNVSNVCCMRRMFANCEHFNQPLTEWSVDCVEDMSEMLRGCSLFNQPLANWNVSSVVDMRGMFGEAVVFDQDVSGWSVGRVRNMSGMWWYAKSFNQSLSEWDVSQVVAMDGMFGGAESFNQSLEHWDVKELVTCRGIVRGSGYKGSFFRWGEALVISATVLFNFAGNPAVKGIDEEHSEGSGDNKDDEIDNQASSHDDEDVMNTKACSEGDGGGDGCGDLGDGDVERGQEGAEMIS